MGFGIPALFGVSLDMPKSGSANIIALRSKMPPAFRGEQILYGDGARDRTRTGMELPPRDFKSLASTIPPLGRKRKDTTKPGLSQMFIGGCSKTVEIVEGKVGVFLLMTVSAKPFLAIKPNR